MKRFASLVALAILAPVLLGGCAATVALQPAADATDVACASVVVHLPDTVSELASRETNAQGTGAWGTPTSVLLRCGVTVPGPSTLPCVQVGSIYWIREDLGDKKFSFTTYGRKPATQVIVDNAAVPAGPVLYTLENAISFTAATGRECSSIEDSLNPDAAETATPTPTPTPTPTVVPTN